MTRAEDLEAIQRLRDRDVAASKAYDADALAALFTEDAVVLGPGRPPARGMAAIRVGLRHMVAAVDIEVLDYSEVFEETLLFGDTAVEWGRVEGAERVRGGPGVSRSCVHLMRILRRQPDGSWRIHRTIFAPAPVPEGP